MSAEAMNATSDAHPWLTEARDAVVLVGADALSYLASQASQDVAAMTVGESRWTMVLAPDGKVDVLARVWRSDDTTVVLDTDEGYGEVLEKRLRRFMIRVDVTVSRQAMVATTPPDDSATSAGVAADAVVGWWGRDQVFLGDEAAVPVGATAGDAQELHAARVHAAWPRMGAEIEPGEQIAPAVGVVAVAVSFTKGCYPGQELVERMDSRGAQAPRRLCQLAVEGTVVPGDPIVADGVEVGHYTSVADGVALGYVKRGADVGVAIADVAGV